MPLLLMAWMACAEPEETSTKPESLGDPLIELGTGEWEWESLEDVTEMPIIQGPQGGFHFLGSVRVSGIYPGDAKNLADPNNPTTAFSVLFNGEDITMSATYTQGLEQAPSAAEPFRHEMVGRFVIVDILADEELENAEVELGVTVTDVFGTELHATQQVAVYPHPFNH